MMPEHADSRTVADFWLELRGFQMYLTTSTYLCLETVNFEQLIGSKETSIITQVQVSK